MSRESSPVKSEKQIAIEKKRGVSIDVGSGLDDERTSSARAK